MKRKMFFQKWWILLVELLLTSMSLLWKCSLSETTCPSYKELPYCTCLVVDDQLHVQCSGNDIPTLEKSLQVLNGPVKSFSVYDLDSRATILPNGLTDNVTSPVLHFQLSHSSLEDLGETSLRGLSKSLESLAVISARLKYIPQMTLSTVKRLKVLDFEGNNIEELGPYSFNSVLLQKVNLKRNQLENISENAFWGLSDSLTEIDLSENKLKTFPYAALRKLRQLSSLNLEWNEMNDLSVLSSLLPIPTAGSTTTIAEMEWPLLKYLNLNSNYFRKLEKDTFISMSNLRTLSIHLNSIEYVDEDAFISLLFLESIDLSHNKITFLPSGTFQRTPNIATIDLSNNHLHGVSEGLFNNLGYLRDLLLNGNNILELSMNTFIGSPNIQVIYLQQNALRVVESGVFNPLRNLSEIRLSENFLRILPQDLFLYNTKLSSLSLDGNMLTKVVPGTLSNCKNLKELRLQNNKITTVPSGVLEKLSMLEEVHLENNRLSLIEGLGALKSLRYVSLSRNHLDRITSELLPTIDLNSLSLGNNFIQSIQDGAFSNQTTLSVLFLANNKISRLGAKTFVGLKNLLRLHLQKNNISWIHEAAFFRNIKSIQYIDLSYNAMQTIGKTLFTNLQHIEEINLAHNEIIALENGMFSTLQNLRIIDLSHNRLTSIEYSKHFHFYKLETLKICCNLLKVFTVVSPKISTRTEFLNAARASSSSALSSSPSNFLQLQQQPTTLGLKELDIRENQLGSSTFKLLEMPLLKVLQVCGNNLTDLDESTLKGFPSLNFFTAENCQLTILPSDMFKYNPNIAVIRLSENFIQWIPDTIFHSTTRTYTNSENSNSNSHNNNNNNNNNNNVNLRELHLRNNKLRKFPYKALINITNLEVLTLSGNLISLLDINHIHLLRLKQFDMNNNELIKIISSNSGLSKSMPVLEVIDFGENNLTRINDDLIKNVSLTQMNFGGNLFQKIPFAFSTIFISTSYLLNMSGNPLVNFYTENHPLEPFNVMDLYLTDMNVTFLTGEEFQVYPKLHRLVIKRNPLNGLPANAFSALNNLNLLDLSENLIDNLKQNTFSGLVQLKSLNLSHNKIKILTYFHKDLGNLQDLDLSFNQLSRLQPDSFTPLVSLSFLRLRGNWLSTLGSDLFGSLVRLAILDLSHNFIENVPTQVLKDLETRISTLKLEENPLNCDCQNRALWEWLQSHPKILITSTVFGDSKFICEKPKEFKGRLMMQSDIFALCSPSAIEKLAVQDVRPSSAIVSWQGRNNSGMQGYVVAYHALNHNDVVKTRALPATSRLYHLPGLEADTPYIVCVVGLSAEDQDRLRSADDLLKDSKRSKCTQVRTLGSEEAEKASLFHRRLGVFIGALVAMIVFTSLLTTLIVIKIRNKRRLRQQLNGKLGNQDANESLNSPTGTEPLGFTHDSQQDQDHFLPPPPPVHFRNGNGNNNGTSSSSTLPRNPEFSTYRHYVPPESSSAAYRSHHHRLLHPVQESGAELERL